MDSILFWM
jgi:hypothetical protein